ncbi:unnamed protein product [Didymodactylos carnosus]|uniref:Uncharacterized protein n=1 Tax=Didymodactylos carnosus TaxID=1234261 RepID=A0A815EG11_9BILA|nr:unnamed protein product [Didymodactylos carnosus]CAF1312011.1 unnamed protein product [Didymodactylos carnosus]CAF3922529.1 unnamed protein product [Didymodactylos carnosus]CAF4150347.1 unnamed protein product [Didymodactylos carnosus]
MNVLIILPISFYLLSLFVQTSFMCICPSTTDLSHEFDATDFLFIGEVQNVSRNYMNGRTNIEFKILKVLKGYFSTSTDNVVVVGPLGEHLCEIAFKVGQKWQIWSYYELKKEKKVIVTERCTRSTMNFTDTEAELNAYSQEWMARTTSVHPRLITTIDSVTKTVHLETVSNDINTVIDKPHSHSVNERERQSHSTPIICSRINAKNRICSNYLLVLLTTTSLFILFL